jgi:hypothetical protein
VHGLYNDYDEDDDRDVDSSDDGNNSNSNSRRGGGRGATNRAAPQSSRTLESGVTRTEMFKNDTSETAMGSELHERGASVMEEMEMHSVHNDDGGDEEEELGVGFSASAGSSRTTSYSVNIKQCGPFFGGVKSGSVVPVAGEEDFLGGPAAAQHGVAGEWPGQQQARMGGDMA